MLTEAIATARAWAEIDVDSLLHNYQLALSELTPGVAHFVVIKANAYGIGAVSVAKLLYAEGARLFAVSCAMEALELRMHAVPADADILVMGATAPAEMDLMIENGIMPTIFRREDAALLSERATALGKTARFHCKVDTGLHRLGFAPEEAADAIADIVRLPGLRFEGLFSHLQRRSRAHDIAQGETLTAVRDALVAKGVAIPMLHLLDSIGMWRYPENQFDAVRDAAFLVGHTQPDYPHPERLRFCLSFKTRIVRIHDAPAGVCLGYDSEHPLTRPTRVATLSCGYADGYPRAMSHVGEVEIRGRRAKVLGVICMDLMMVDIGDIPEAAVGDEVTLLGGSIDIATYAGFSDGYRNEYTSMISRRVPRVYRRGGQVVDIVGYMP